MKAKILLTLFLFSLSSFAFSSVYKENAKASYYAEKYHGRKTANGEIFNMNAMTCAHKTLPFGTVLRVTNLANGKNVDVRVNDRGPFVKDREIDVSKAAAQKLGMIKTGTANVKIEILSPNKTVKKSDDPHELWDVQIASFSNQENASRLAQNLLKSGFKNVYFQKTERVVRVVLKRIPDEDLRATEERLRLNGYAGYIVKKTI
ncbi:septal ring lytic transglycosylase RlpA family protein [uncultured Treponema sp.]|uniref:septal ring lytic transglycosylase RlpA family protein n=1 Tax=uncultured Treponema sp. TaxID=162155 RepID=UPI0025E585CA|nr:septal ring lytic transglycosylase RlpA family protein [uncultured Treponema sp.]